MMMSLKRHVLGSQSLAARSLSYVARYDLAKVHSENLNVFRARFLEQIKTDDKFCTEQLEAGHFLLYHKVLKLVTWP